VEKPFQVKYMRENILRHYINRNKSISWYPFVRKIGENRLPLEMDLILVENDTGTGVGYEFKYLDYEKPWKNYYNLYKGLDQIFSYFTYGIDQGWLIIGVSKKVADQISEKLIEFTATIESHFKATKASYVGLHIKYDDRTFRILPVGVNNTLIRLPIKNTLVQRDHDNIVKGNLSKNQTWLLDNHLPILM